MLIGPTATGLASRSLREIARPSINQRGR